MPILERYEVQENRIWYRAKVTEEQLKEFNETRGEENNQWCWPEWIWDLDWDHHNDKPGNDDVVYIKQIRDEKEDDSDIKVVI